LCPEYPPSIGKDPASGEISGFIICLGARQAFWEPLHFPLHFCRPATLTCLPIQASRVTGIPCKTIPFLSPLLIHLCLCKWLEKQFSAYFWSLRASWEAYYWKIRNWKATS
jgi:hypothetical protein